MIEPNSLNEILSSYKIKALCIGSDQTDNYTFYDLKLLPGGKVRDILKYSEELSLGIKSFSKPTVKVLTAEGVVRVGFAKNHNSRLELFNILPKNNNNLNCVLGKTVEGNLMKMDLAQNPHMLIAGTTGSGKSVLLHNIIANLLNNNSSKLVLMDPKNIEFSCYSNNMNNVYVKHLFDECLTTIKYLSDLMDYRYKLMTKGVNQTRMPYIVLIIDEFADLIMQDENKELYYHLCRLAQMGRAAKMHIILATQRPTVDVINGTIKANFPARISCKVSSATDSRVILDCKGAENLSGKGDALLKDDSRPLERFQVAFTSSSQVYERFKTNSKTFN